MSLFDVQRTGTRMVGRHTIEIESEVCETDRHQFAYSQTNLPYR